MLFGNWSRVCSRITSHLPPLGPTATHSYWLLPAGTNEPVAKGKRKKEALKSYKKSQLIIEQVGFVAGFDLYSFFGSHIYYCQGE